MKKVRLIISGDVQGVGFRSYVKAAAKKLNLTGWVKNRPDDTVEAVAEGSEDSLKQFVELCHKGPTVAWVEDMQVEWSDYLGEFDIFEVVQ